jgi:hypothetical protein
MKESEEDNAQPAETSDLDQFAADDANAQREDNGSLDKFSANDETVAAEDMPSVEELDIAEPESSDQVEDIGLSVDDGIEEELPQDTEQTENTVG